MSEEQQDDWDPQATTVLEDQRRTYDEMREKCPVAHSNFMGSSLFRHQDITAVLADVETYSNKSLFLAIPNGMDPPIHERYQKALIPNFSKNQMEKLEPQVRKIATGLIASACSGETLDFIGAFVTPYVLKSLCVFLGWPEDQWESIGGWVHGNQQAAFSRDAVAGKALAQLFAEHVKTNLKAQRVSLNNSEGATCALLNTKVDDMRLDDDQIVSILRNWAAGHGTVSAGLSILVFHLAQDSNLQDQLRKDPSLIPAAIEEILRSDGPLVANRRVTTREVRIGDKTIPQGANVALMWIAANRDPRVFDKPDSIKIERDTEDSLVWGQGIHFCLGASLARLEMRVALEELLSRTKYFKLAGHNQCRAIYPSNGFAELFLSLCKSSSITCV
jgi:cytochrome P450